VRFVWVFTLVVVVSVTLAADWKGDIAKRAVGRAVREGLQDAAKDAALDAALDSVLPAAAERGFQFGAVAKVVDVAPDVTDGIQTAMRVADIADKLDNAADAANALRKISKLGKLKR
jgi:hypothetical protein